MSVVCVGGIAGVCLHRPMRLQSINVVGESIQNPDSEACCSWFFRPACLARSILRVWSPLTGPKQPWERERTSLMAHACRGDAMWKHTHTHCPA